MKYQFVEKTVANNVWSTEQRKGKSIIDIPPEAICITINEIVAETEEYTCEYTVVQWLEPVED